MFLYGFVGSAPCGGLLLEKLQACTQPGLDGYGAALMQGGELLCAKSKESVTALAQQLPESAAPCGLVHARFATCGGRTAENVHPFVTDDYCLAMNGTVENAVALRSALNLLPYPDSPLARAGGTLLSLPCSLPGGLPPVTHFVLGYVLLALVAVDWGLRQKTITPLFGRMAVKLCATLPDKLRLILKSGSELDALAAYLSGYDRLLFVGQNIDLAAAGAMAGVWSRTLGVPVETVPAAELRHTLLPTVDSHTALVALISSRELTEKTCAALQLAAIRGAGTVACTVESLAGQLSGARQVFLFPDSLPLLAPVCQCATLSMLLLRLCTAREQAGRPVEQPPVLPRYFAG